MIESKQISLSYGYNYFTNDKLNISFVKKGYIPRIRFLSGSMTSYVYLVTKTSNSLYPDYVCYNVSLSNGTLIGFRNMTTVKTAIGSSTSNIAMQLKFEDPTLINVTSSFAYLAFGTFLPYLYSTYGGNFYNTLNTKSIMVRNIDPYPIQSNFLSYLLF